MNEILGLALAAITGILLGIVYFGGLWWTVKKTNQFKRPALWFIGSFLLRTGIVLLGFFGIGNGHWERMMVCLLGFILGRIIVKLLVQQGGKKHTYTVQEGSHEPQS